MTNASNLRFDYSVRSDVGLVRRVNEDSALACSVLLAVADGLGGHAAGEVASRLAITRVGTLVDPAHSADEMSAHFHEVVDDATSDIAACIAAEPESYGMGTTLTCLALAGGALVVGHIGDSRAYLLRAGALERLTVDHTYVQQLIDAGQISEDDVPHHPQRSVILRAIGANKGSQADISIRDIQVGDRVLVCSDGLSSVVPEGQITSALQESGDPASAVTRLVDSALDLGAPDNVTCIVADVVGHDEALDLSPTFAGAAASRTQDHVAIEETTTARSNTRASQSAVRATIRRYRTLLVFIAGVLATLATISLLLWSQWWIGVRDGYVVIGRGMPEPVLGIQVNEVVQTTRMLESQLPAFQRTQIEQTIHADSLEHAQRIVNGLSCSVMAPGQWCPHP